MAELVLPDIETMRDQFLEDLELGAIDAGVASPPIEPGTDWYALATAVANLESIGVQNIALSVNDITPLTAAEPKLDDWRQSFGLPVVPASFAKGKIIVETTGSATITAGTQLTHATGSRYAVDETMLGVANYDEIDVTCLDAGADGNLDAGEVLQFVAPPVNVKTRAVVSDTDPIQDGLDAEDEERKRDRILNRTATAPGGGNWGQLRQIALEASPAVQDAYVYPALGGPASCKVVITRKFDPKRRVFTREPSDSLVEIVRSAIQTNAADMTNVVVQGAADQNVDVALQLDIPDAVSVGGDGNGWVDASPWPSLNGDTYVTVTGVVSERRVNLSALTTTAPIIGVTKIARWSTVDREFQVRTIVLYSGSAGSWSVTVDEPFSDSDGSVVAVGDYICPVSANIEKYGETWRSILENLGPGENTSDAARLPRSSRHPLTSSEDSPNLTSAQLRQFGNAHTEVEDISYSYRSLTGPSVPASIATAPNVLSPYRFGIYPMV